MKILVNVSVPAVSASYEVLLPTFLTVDELIPLIARGVEDSSDQTYISSGNEVLCRKEDARLLPPDKTAGELQLENGDHLVLL